MQIINPKTILFVLQTFVCLSLVGCFSFSNESIQEANSATKKMPSPKLTYKLDLVHKIKIDLKKIVKDSDRYTKIKIFTNSNNQCLINIDERFNKLEEVSIASDKGKKSFSVTYYKKNGHVFTKVFNE